MKLSDHDLLQLTERELLELPEEVLRRLSIKLLVDLKEVWERPKQTSRNSSRPPSSDAPWSDANSPDVQADTTPADEQAPTDDISPDHDEAASPAKKESPGQGQRKAGKQLGAPGYGREQNTRSPQNTRITRAIVSVAIAY